LLPPIKYYPEKKSVNFEIKKTKDKNPINLWRIKYIREEFEESEFADGYPAWYIMSETTVYENYSTKTNRRGDRNCPSDWRNGITPDETETLRRNIV
jgi:hypothetical protein